MKYTPKTLCCLALLVAVLFLQADALLAAPASRPAQAKLHFTKVRPGVEFAVASMDGEKPSFTDDAFIAIRISPKNNIFTLCMASQSGQSRSLPDWAVKERLIAGINAGMYLPDHKTNTGYMRSGSTINNPAMGGRLGAFFVAARKNNRLPKADIIEKSLAGWEKRLAAYDTVVQNYRLVSSDGKMLWQEGKSSHSIAVVAKDKKGNLLFVLCQKSLSVEDFTRTLKEFIPNVGVVMYVEGGSEAGLFLRMPSVEKAAGKKPDAMYGASVRPVPGGLVYVWKGRQSLLGLPGSADAELPNIIGVLF
ncbi:phosphodiester glycosidase family protein [Desulfovibrio sp. OttesenSCG-928-G15]|nr:phosphodiester glycosidase family protein [Desulfovibrio sp. OttesenSCG-928-G15]